MRILDRYILKSIVGILITCIGTFLFLYCIIDIFANLDDILKNKVPLLILFQYYLTNLPNIFVMVTPIACLLSTLYTFGKLNRDNEVIAMRAAGLSIHQITRTITVLGCILSLSIFIVNDRFVPQAAVLNQKFKAQIQGETKKFQEEKSREITNLSMYGMNNRLYFIGKFSPANSAIEQITILEHDEHQNITRKIVANRGVFSENGWKFYECMTYSYDAHGQMSLDPRYEQEEVVAIPETPKDFLTQRQRPEYMTISQLDDYLWKLSKSGATGVIRNLKVELYQRYTSAFMSIVIIFLGIPFALMMKKRATGMSSLGLSIMMGFLYYVVNAVSLALGKSGFLPPLLAASLSHILAFSLSLYFISKLP